jgi:hypothetical protein
LNLNGVFGGVPLGDKVKILPVAVGANDSGPPTCYIQNRTLPWVRSLLAHPCPPLTYDINPTSHTLAPEPRLGEPADGLRDALADRYRLIRELGRGGMATVYLAQDLRHDRPVALKVLHPELAAPSAPSAFSARSSSPPGCSTPTS